MTTDFNFSGQQMHVTAKASQINQGDNRGVSQFSTATDHVQAIKLMFEDFQEQLKGKSFPSKMPEDLRGEFETPSHMLDICSKQASAEVEAAKEFKDEEVEMIWKQRFSWLKKIGLTVSTTFAKELIKRSPVSPILAACKAGLDVMDSIEFRGNP